jgi:inner membrane protein
MDIITQGILGAAVAQSAARKEHVRLATTIGVFAGVIADADIFIRSSTDPLLFLEYHRHFTHSIFFIPIGACVTFLLLWPFLHKKLSARFLYLYCFLGYLFSGFIDTCTSYGTHLFWPVINTRTTWHFISVVDPVFTGILLIAIITGFKTRKVRFSRIGLILAASYLLLAVLQLNRAEKAIYQLAEQRGHTIEKIMVKPTLANIILWRSIYLTNNVFYIDAVRAGSSTRLYQGSSIEKFNMKEAFPNLDANSVLAKDIKRFEYFSDGYVGLHPKRPDILGDVRYSMSPLGLIPLWGIEMNLDDTNQHVKYEAFRNASKAVRQQYIDMLMNKSLNNM